MDRNEILKTVTEVISKIKKNSYNLDEINEDTFLGGDMGVDSVEMLEALHDLQKKYNIKISNDDMADIYTMQNVIDLIVKYLNK